MAIFKKKRKYFTLDTHAVEKQQATERKPSVPEGVWHKCRGCEKMILKEELSKNQLICPKCGTYERMGAWDRIALIADEGSFKEINGNIVGLNPLDFPGYDEKIEKIQKKTKTFEGIITGYCTIHGIKVAMGVMEPLFIMGSMGSAVGEKVALLAEFAQFYNLPLLIFSASGGARMQEGIISLMQMTKASYAIRKHAEKGLLYISVPTDPTTGGVTASFAMLGDIIISEPKTLIGFAGRRVIEGTIRKELPADFQSAEFLLGHGFLDAVVKRKEMKNYLHKLLLFHGGEI
ncbi:MAG TPA: acetyl-CoA carboxylase, carboxyltransferase subunit beta [Proteiniclasticum sp.]|nr:acetyl-CoA carboxylase, carboxyltransferase subunit beta [Proteiniclasticum sp.]